jgi:hypothetical protein
MTQMKVFGWTNPATAVVRNESIGFTVSQITVTNITDGEQYYWNSAMADASWILVDTGAYTNTNGFTPLAQSTAVGAILSGFTNANPGVLTVNDTATFGFAAGDTIKVSEIADDLTGDESLNNNFTVASVTATTITLVEDTTVTGYSVYVSGGVVTRVTDTDDKPIPIENLAIGGITLGTGVVGGNDDVMVAVVHGENVVV